MRNKNYFLSCALISTLLFSAVPGLEAQDAVDALMVQPVNLSTAVEDSGAQSGAQPPREILELLRGRLIDLFISLGGFEAVEAENDAQILLEPAVTEYRLMQDDEFGLIVEMELMMELREGALGSERTLPYRRAVRAIGTGASHIAAALQAVDELVKQYRHDLIASPVLSNGNDRQVLRVKDSLAGRVILSRGARDGLRAGTEYRTAIPQPSGAKNQAERPAILKIAEVYPEFAEAHVLYGRDLLAPGTPVEPVQQLGLRTAVEVNYVHKMSSWQSAAEHLGGMSLRLYYDRGLFSISPLFKLDYLSNHAAFLHTGTALNWYAGRLKIAPALMAGLGFSAAGSSAEASSSLYWGGSVEVVLSWRINRSLLFSVDAGASGWYHTGNEFQEARFLYAGSGFMLKY